MIYSVITENLSMEHFEPFPKGLTGFFYKLYEFNIPAELPSWGWFNNWVYTVSVILIPVYSGVVWALNERSWMDQSLSTPLLLACDGFSSEP